MSRKLDADLATHHFLFGMSRQDVGLLADCAVRTHFEAGKVVFRAGEHANQLHLVETGAVALLAGSGADEVVVETVRAGELLGLSWLFPPHRWRVTARACEPTSTFALNGELLRDYAERDHTLGYQLYKRFTEVQNRRLQSMRERLIGSSSAQAQSGACE